MLKTTMFQNYCSGCRRVTANPVMCDECVSEHATHPPSVPQTFVIPKMDPYPSFDVYFWTITSVIKLMDDKTSNGRWSLDLVERCRREGNALVIVTSVGEFYYFYSADIPEKQRQGIYIQTEAYCLSYRFAPSDLYYANNINEWERKLVRRVREFELQWRNEKYHDELQNSV